MRIEIKTKQPIKDKDIKALYVIDRGLNMAGNDRLKIITLEFFAGRFGLKLVPNK